jgi:aspartyl/glutamyl-tRNA(Asn/Gln) amidotransferase A subunit/peptide chain release factor 1
MRVHARRAARGVARARSNATASTSAASWPRTVAEAARALDARALTAVDLLSHCARRVDADALTSRAFVGSAASRDAHARRALADARASDARRERGETEGEADGEARRRASALDGVPFAAKDNLCANVGTTSAGSRILEGYESPIEATAIARLRALGGVLIGKTNMDEFGMGSHTRTSGQTTLNPTSSDGERSSGGSSGGSAAAVVNGSAFYALGSDTGGSVRLPAAYCGAVGLKPTYGRVSRFGLVSYCSSLDTVGVLARTVSDAGVVLAAIQGEDALDATTVARCKDLDAAALEFVDETTPKAASLKGLRVGVPEEYAVSELTQEVYDAWNEMVRAMEALGAEIVRVNMPHTEAALPCYYVLAPAEASSNLARYDGMRYGDLTRDLSREEYLAEEFQSAIAKARSLGFGDEVRRRVTVGAFALSSARAAEYFEKAQKVRRLVSDDFTNVFGGEGGGVDVLLTPSSVSTAPKLSDVEALSPAQTYAADVMTVPASLAGLPAMSMPAGRSRASGLPIGMQMIAPKFREARLVRVGSTLERAMAGTRSYSSSTSSTDALEERGEAALRRREELIALISRQGVDIDRVVEANKELSRIEPIAEQYEVVKKLRAEKASLEELVRDASSGGDSKELAELAREELRAVDIDLPDQELALQLLFLPHDDADDRGAILEVRAGAGGDEAALFAAELFRMYALHARKSGWRFDTLNVSETDGKGVREASAEILGKGVFGRLKFESGVHRVQRVPETETQGRVHTSTASVAVLPHAEEVEMDIKEEDVRIDTMRASGAGGQHVNTTNSAVRLTHAPTGIQVVIQDERSQHKNKAKAFSVLKARLYDLEREKMAKERSELRSSLIGTGDRSERIRTYNFAQGRVKDHRVEGTISDVNALMDGFLLDEITEKLKRKRVEELLAGA